MGHVLFRKALLLLGDTITVWMDDGKSAAGNTPGFLAKRSVPRHTNHSAFNASLR